MDGASGLAPETFDAWSELWHGAALAHDSRLTFDVVRRWEPESAHAEWRVAHR